MQPARATDCRVLDREVERRPTVRTTIRQDGGARYLAGGQDDARPDVEDEVGRRWPAAAQRQTARRPDPAGVGVEAGQVQPALREPEVCAGTSGPILAFGGHGDGPVGPAGATGETEHDTRGPKGKAGQIDGGDIGDQVGAGLRKRPGEGAGPLRLARYLDRSGAERTGGVPVQLEFQGPDRADLPGGADRAQRAFEPRLGHRHHAPAILRLAPQLRRGAQQAVEFGEAGGEAGALCIEGKHPGFVSTALGCRPGRGGPPSGADPGGLEVGDLRVALE